MRTSLVIALDRLLPEFSDITLTVLTKPDVDQEITKLIARLEVGRCLGGGPLINRPSASGRAIPTTKLTSSLRLVVEGCAKGDDPFNLLIGCTSATQEGIVQMGMVDLLRRQ